MRGGQPSGRRAVARKLPYDFRTTMRATLLLRLVLCMLGSSALLWLGGCAAVGRVAQLDDGWYHVAHLGGNDSLAARLQQSPQQLVYVQQRADTLLFAPYSTQPAPAITRYRLQPEHHVLLLSRTFDLDIFTLPVKARPPREGVPVQLNTNFSAALYIGRRLDYYYLHSRSLTPWQQTAHIRATGLGYGLFFGMGSTNVTDDVTRQHSGPEYEGFVLHAGVAAIYDAHIFNVGLAAGADHLLGPDRAYWVYQHQPWIGVLFGLDLN